MLSVARLDVVMVSVVAPLSIYQNQTKYLTGTNTPACIFSMFETKSKSKSIS
jgi:hypothetical protein